MLNIKRAVENERLLRALTGLNRKGFEELCKLFSVAYEEWVERESFPRQRARGGGRKARLRRMEEKLFFILFYFKCYPTFDVLGFLFNLERGRANRWVHRLQPILEATLGKKMMLPERKIESSEQFVARFPGVREVDRKNHPMIRHYPKRYQQTTSPDRASFLVLDLISVEPELQTAPFLWA